MTERFDVMILGSGNAGMAAAGALRAAGKSVAMVESWDVGGTCPLRGCVPKKVLVAAAQVLHQIALAPQHHIEVGAPKLDWGALIARERGFVAFAMKQGVGAQGLGDLVTADPTFAADIEHML